MNPLVIREALCASRFVLRGGRFRKTEASLSPDSTEVFCAVYMRRAEHAGSLYRTVPFRFGVCFERQQ